MNLGDLVYLLQAEEVQICIDDWDNYDSLKYNSLVLKLLEDKEVISAEAIAQDVIRVELRGLNV